jgi:DNA-binding transcriptional LysR family regulator
MPQDLAEHRCIHLRLPTAGEFYAWELEQGSRDLRVRVDGQFVSNNAQMIVHAALDGLGLACGLEDVVADHVACGSLVRLLAHWCPPLAEYHLYDPSGRQPSAAFALLVETLRYRPGRSSITGT